MRRYLLISHVFSLFLLAAPHAQAAETLPGRVVGVPDGDILRVDRREEGTIKVRLFGIDCPEKGQGYELEARGVGNEVRGSIPLSSTTDSLLFLHTQHPYP